MTLETFSTLPNESTQYGIVSTHVKSISGQLWSYTVTRVPILAKRFPEAVPKVKQRRAEIDEIRVEWNHAGKGPHRPAWSNRQFISRYACAR